MTGYLAVMMRDGSNYKSGDIVQAFNAFDVKCCHANGICQADGFKSKSYWRAPKSLWEYWCERTYKYRFEYIDAKSVRRVTLATHSVDVFNKGEINAAAYVNRHHKFLFNDSGKVYWYGGEGMPTVTRLDEIAAQIKSRGKGDLDAAPLNHFPFGHQDRKSFFLLHTPDFTSPLPCFFTMF